MLCLPGEINNSWGAIEFNRFTKSCFDKKKRTVLKVSFVGELK